jgi:hypothetical protein
MSYQTIPYFFASGTTAIASQWNSNYSAVISGLVDGTKDLNINNLSVASNFSIVNDLNSLVNISSTVTISGFSSLGSKYFYYKSLGHTFLLYFNISGTSNGLAVPQITGLPFSANKGTNLICTGDNSGNYFGRLYSLTPFLSTILNADIKYNDETYITPAGKSLQMSGQCVFTDL